MKVYVDVREKIQNRMGNHPQKGERNKPRMNKNLTKKPTNIWPIILDQRNPKILRNGCPQ